MLCDQLLTVAYVACVAPRLTELVAWAIDPTVCVHLSVGMEDTIPLGLTEIDPIPRNTVIFSAIQFFFRCEMILQSRYVVEGYVVCLLILSSSLSRKTAWTCIACGSDWLDGKSPHPRTPSGTVSPISLVPGPGRFDPDGRFHDRSRKIHDRSPFRSHRPLVLCVWVVYDHHPR